MATLPKVKAFVQETRRRRGQFAAKSGDGFSNSWHASLAIPPRQWWFAT